MILEDPVIVQEAFYNVSMRNTIAYGYVTHLNCFHWKFLRLSDWKHRVDTKVQEAAATSAELVSSADNSCSSFLHGDKSILPSNAPGLAEWLVPYIL